MIRVNYVMKRAPGVSAAEFESRLRDVYGPLVAGRQVALGIVRCVQSYTLRKDTVGEALRAARTGMHGPFDGTVAFWWPGRERMEESLASPAGRAAFEELVECERGFVDLQGSSVFLVREVPQINPLPEDALLAKRGSSIVKLIYVLHALPALGRRGCQHWWQTRHGAITRRYGTAMGFLRYVQSHTIDDPLNEVLRGLRGSLPPYDGLTEVWFDRLFLASVMGDPDSEGAEGFGTLLEDERSFVDLSRSSTWFSKEQVLVER